MWKKFKTWIGGLGLVIAGILSLLLFQPDNSPEVISSRILANINSEVTAVNTQFVNLFSDLENGTVDLWNSRERESGYWFYVFRGKSLSFWSTNRLIINFIIVR